MAHSIEVATSGRSKCRGCGKRIEKGSLRLGERLPNVFTDEGEVTLWFHLDCGALVRPDAMLAAMDDCAHSLTDAEALRAAADLGVAHPRLQRIVGLERAKTGRAVCRQCRQPIPKDSARIALQFFEDTRFVPAGYLHPACGEAYFGVASFGDRLRHFCPGDSELVAEALEGSA